MTAFRLSPTRVLSISAATPTLAEAALASTGTEFTRASGSVGDNDSGSDTPSKRPPSPALPLPISLLQPKPTPTYHVGGPLSSFGSSVWSFIHHWSVPVYLALLLGCWWWPHPSLFRLLSNLLLNTALRVAMLWLMQYANFDDEISGAQRIDHRPILHKQAAREQNYDLHMHLTIAFLSFLHYCYPVFRDMPAFTARSFVFGALIHMLLSESVYYAFHRLLHVPFFYKHFHSFHHGSVVTEPATGTVQDALELSCYLLIVSLPISLPTVLGCTTSMAWVHCYLVAFDFANAVGHCNFEWSWPLLHASPFRYLFYTACTTPSTRPTTRCSCPCGTSCSAHTGTRRRCRR